jgi:hypothetical protein
MDFLAAAATTATTKTPGQKKSTGAQQQELESTFDVMPWVCYHQCLVFEE